MGLGIAGSEPGSLVPVEPLATWEGHWEKGTPESSSATATFELVNRGGRPVHITETRSGCGCAKPQVDIETVKPGQTVRVNVSAIPISTGVKDVPITVISDSPTTPEVPLTLRIIGTRKPPYLYSLTGDLSFRGKYAADMHQTVTTTTIEMDGVPTRDLEFKSALPFLTFALEETSVDPGMSAGTVFRTSKYRVGLAERPPAGTLSGEVILKDPWDGDLDQRLGVLVDLDSGGVRVAPNPVAISGPDAPETTLLVTTNEPVASIDVAQDPGPFALAVEVQKHDKPAKIHRVKVVLVDPKAGESGKTQLKIRVPGQEAEVIVPVRIGSVN